MRRTKQLLLCLGFVVSVSLSGEIVRLALAQAAEDDASLDFVKSQLARVRAGTPAAESITDSVSAREIESESARLLAEEEALLNQIQGKSAPLPSESARAAAATETHASTHSAQDAARASADLNQAIASLEAALGMDSNSEAPTDVVEVRGSVAAIQDKRSVSRAQSSVKSVEESSPANPQPLAVRAAQAPAETQADSVDSMLAAVRMPEQNTENQVTTRIQETKSNISEAASQNQVNAGQIRELQGLRGSNAELRRQLEATQRRLREATTELNESRDRLMIAETEVERLSNVLEQRNRSTLVRVAPAVAQAQNQAARRQYQAPQPSVNTAPQSAPPQRLVRAEAPKSDMLIGTVSVEKANLRSGPGKGNSPLMSVSRGTRLVIETRQGSWYRVITPTGTRAWVASEVLSFGGDGLSNPTRTVQVHGVEG